jgi:hypothetical protein
MYNHLFNNLRLLCKIKISLSTNNLKYSLPAKHPANQVHEFLIRFRRG